MRLRRGAGLQVCTMSSDLPVDELAVGAPGSPKPWLTYYRKGLLLCNRLSRWAEVRRGIHVSNYCSRYRPRWLGHVSDTEGQMWALDVTAPGSWV